jgi:hypothetical protein
MNQIKNIKLLCQKYNSTCEITEYDLNDWPNPWPYCGCAGVYLVVNDHNEVIYVGEAAELGRRLSDHFVGDADNRVICKDGWNNPSCIIAVKMPDDRKAFRKTLEEELINLYWPTGKLYNVKIN